MSATRKGTFSLLFVTVVLVFAGPACDDEGSGSDSGSDVPDPVCDALLTPSDFMDVCGMELTLEPTEFEGIELNPCNRETAEGDVLLLVSRHGSEEVAELGADVAGGRGPTLFGTTHTSAGAQSVFVVEVKVRDEAGAVCAPETAPLLLDLALSRI